MPGTNSLLVPLTVRCGQRVPATFRLGVLPPTSAGPCRAPSYEPGSSGRGDDRTETVPDWVAAAGYPATGGETRPVRSDPYAVTPSVVATPPTGWLRAGMRFVRTMLLRNDLDHRASRGGGNPSQGQPPMTVDAYIGTDFPESAQFRAIPRRRGIRTPSPRGRIRPKHTLAAWRTRRLNAPHGAIAESRSDLLYIRCAREEQYCAQLFRLFERVGGDVNPRPHAQLVAFPRPFDPWYSVADRVRWDENSAKEGRLRWR